MRRPLRTTPPMRAAASWNERPPGHGRARVRAERRVEAVHVEGHVHVARQRFEDAPDRRRPGLALEARLREPRVVVLDDPPARALGVRVLLLGEIAQPDLDDPADLRAALRGVVDHGRVDCR